VSGVKNKRNANNRELPGTNSKPSTPLGMPPLLDTVKGAAREMAQWDRRKRPV
jgi:hypothetical protein